MTVPPPPLISQVALDVVSTVAVWMELFVYGIYTTLFARSICILWKKNVTGFHNGALILLYTALLMYALATIHIGLTIYRFLKTYTLVADPTARTSDLFNFDKWDTILNYAIFSAMIWLGDALVIYRCYFVWNKNYWVILVPVLILMTSIGLGLFIVLDINRSHEAGLLTLDTLPPGVIAAMYPLSVAENILTTGLIAVKIWRQHQSSTSHGIIDHNSPLSLMRILRIIIESAMIYTFQNILYLILFFCRNPAGLVFQNMIIPSIGVVFVLISLRVHHAKKENSERRYNTSLPRWLDNNTTSVVEFSGPSPPVDDVSSSVSGEVLHAPNAIPLEPLPSSSSSQEKIEGHVHDYEHSMGSNNTTFSDDLDSRQARSK